MLLRKLGPGREGILGILAFIILLLNRVDWEASLTR